MAILTNGLVCIPANGNAIEDVQIEASHVLSVAACYGIVG